MNIKELLEVVDKGWIKKPKGFRVHFQKMIDAELVTEYLPNPNEAPFESDVVAWRYAWKLHMATKSDSAEIAAGELVNICVVDDSDNPIKYYASNRFEVFNRKDAEV